MTRPRIERDRSPGLDLTDIRRAGHRELHLTLRPLSEEQPADAFRRLAAVLDGQDATIVRHEVFASLALKSEIESTVISELGEVESNLTWVGGTALDDNRFYGAHVWAVAGVDVFDIREPEQCETVQNVGRGFSAGGIRHCVIADVLESTRGRGQVTGRHSTAAPCSNVVSGSNGSADCLSSRREELQGRFFSVFDNMERYLHHADMGMSDLVRAWFCLDGICSRYELFNRARNDFYSRCGLCGPKLPASTGVGGRNLGGAPLVANIWAIQAAPGSATICPVVSPLQCSAVDYGSAFSRGIVITETDFRRMLISGTASISQNGCSMHPGNLAAQVERTMQVIEEMLTSQDMRFDDVIRATAYFKITKAANVLEAWRADHRKTWFPVISIQADLCRPELLFEIELDASSSG